MIFEVSLGYIVSAKRVRATWCNTVSKRGEWVLAIARGWMRKRITKCKVFKDDIVIFNTYVLIF